MRVRESKQKRERERLWVVGNEDEDEDEDEGEDEDDDEDDDDDDDDDDDNDDDEDEYDDVCSVLCCVVLFCFVLSCFVLFRFVRPNERSRCHSHGHPSTTWQACDAPSQASGHSNASHPIHVASTPLRKQMTPEHRPQTAC